MLKQWPSRTKPVSYFASSLAADGYDLLVALGHDWTAEGGEFARNLGKTVCIPPPDRAAFREDMKDFIIKYGPTKAVGWRQLNEEVLPDNTPRSVLIETMRLKLALCSPSHSFIGLVDDLRGLRTFDVLGPVDFQRAWRSLLHELECQPWPAFEYVDLLETRIIVDCTRAVVVRAPRFGLAWAFAAALAAFGVSINWWFGLDSNPAKWVNVLAQFATFAALAFVFFPPRNV